MNMDGFSELIEVCGGQQSRVFKAIRNSDQRVVALKVPSGEFPGPRQLSVLKREFEVLNRLEGAGIPAALGYIEQKNSAVLVREWIDGVSLKEYQTQAKVTLDKALEIGIELCRLVGEVHKQNFCHRDLSPNNVIINPTTGLITLLDFCSSLEFPDRARNVVKPKFIEGSMPYMSPEQTGRMNRGLDYRTDFYSLGVVLYELFTGRLPFTTADPNQLIYSHIALEPEAPDQVVPQIPAMISNIILKLMNKSPEARYQSAQGIISDLSLCLSAWKESGEIEPFALASEDFNDWLRISDKLYGRTEETKSLLDAFENTSIGNGQFVFVSGHSGIGKTSLIRELYRPLTAKGGYITSGKYDQVLRHQPYSAILQAVAGLVRQVMTESHDSIEFWKQQILTGVGSNGQVLIDAVPDLELLLGSQPELETLSAEAASTRFSTTFYNLIHALGHSGRPLVFFIDDLQWIDPPSLSLLEAMAPTLSHSTLMIIGAYRDNEVDDNHPLALTMPALKASCSNLLEIELGELPTSVLVEMLRDTLTLPEAEYHQLNDVLCEKTGGNPLAYKTMLSTLYSQECLCFDYTLKHWRWNKKALSLMPKMHNSVALLQENMSSLPTDTLQLLKLAGCIGNCFNLQLLVRLSGRNRVDVAKQLVQAVSKGYIQPIDDDFELYTADDSEQLPDTEFHFLHDRIQQAAYSLLPAGEQCEIHWAIGQQILAEYQGHMTDGQLFDVVEHLNQGCEYATYEQREQLAQLNLSAANKAKQSAAFSVAHSCLTRAKVLLEENQQPLDSELSIAVDIELVQAHYLVAEFEKAESLYAELRDRLTSDTDKLMLYNIQAKQYHHQGEYQKSVEFEYEALRMLGIDLPDEDQALLELFAKEKNKIDALLQQTDYDRLFHQPTVNDANYNLVHELLFDTFTDGYLLGRGPLLAAVAAISARLSIEQGNCHVTSAGFINYATILCSSGEYRLGHEIGKLAVRLADKYNSPVFKNYTYHVFSLGINHWLEPLNSSYDYWFEASKLSKESGSPYAGWVFLQMPHVLLASGAHLEKLQAQTQASLEYLNSNRLGDIAQLLKIIVQQPLEHLKGNTDSFTSLDSEGFSTQQLLSDYQQAPFFLGHTMYSILRATLLAGETLPIDQLREWLPVIESTVQAQIIQVDSCLYTGLHLSTACASAEPAQRQEYLVWLEELIAKFATWAELCPNNFEHKLLMLKAELFKLNGDVLAAFDHYELAREAALNARFLMDAALADELAGRFWQQAGKSYQAQVYLKRALEGYEQWGADGKVAWMAEQYPQLNLVQPPTSMSATMDSTLGSDDFSSILDMAAVLKASQAVSQHINVDMLAEELLNLAVENAGATRGLLLLENGGDFVVTQKVTGEQGSDDQLGLNVPYGESHCLSRSIVRYVINSGQSVVYTPNHHDAQFERCPYLNSQGDISVLCVPIIRQKQMSGVLYLENTHMAEAFQTDRVQTLKIIASQAAISLENARMFRDLKLMNDNLEGLVKERTKKLYEANEQLTEKNQELYMLSTTDQLTGLYNRRYVEERIHEALRQEPGDGSTPVSILMLDIDHFKSINDQFGHDVGDKVIVNVSGSIRKSVRSVDIPGRWGGEEFIVLCMSDLEGAVSNAEKLGNIIAEQDNSPVGQVTVSIGVTSLLSQDTVDSLLTRVDKALYQAKNSGRNQIIIRKK